MINVESVTLRVMYPKQLFIVLSQSCLSNCILPYATDVVVLCLQVKTSSLPLKEFEQGCQLMCLDSEKFFKINTSGMTSCRLVKYYGHFERACLLHPQGICCQRPVLLKIQVLLDVHVMSLGKHFSTLRRRVLPLSSGSSSPVRKGEYTSGTNQFLKITTGKLLGQIGKVLPFYTASYSGKIGYSSVSL